jgi:hypothetical protein
VRWRLAPKPGSKFVCPPWIKLSRTMGIIAPGQASVIEVSVLFDSAAVKCIDNEAVKQIAYLGLSEEVIRQVNAMPEQMLSDILLLRVQNGRDFFISVAASIKLSGDDFAELDREEGAMAYEETHDDRTGLFEREGEDVPAGAPKKMDKLRAAAAATKLRLQAKANELKVKAEASRQKSSGGEASAAPAVRRSSLNDTTVGGGASNPLHTPQPPQQSEARRRLSDITTDIKAFSLFNDGAKKPSGDDQKPRSGGV